MPIKVILCDIEGTTSSINFVKNELFPFSLNHIEAHLQETWDDKRTKAVVQDLLNSDHVKTFYSYTPANVASVADLVKKLIQEDIKLGPVKQLQGMVWSKGYRDGVLRGHIFPDVADAFERWTEAGITIGIYSSGSIEAQRLLFSQTAVGDLLHYITAHFDTQVGHKQQQESYENITKALQVDAGDILFLTDIVKEAEAARAAGLQTIILSRPGNAPLTDDEKSEFIVVQSFDDIKL